MRVKWNWLLFQSKNYSNFNFLRDTCNCFNNYSSYELTGESWCNLKCVGLESLEFKETCGGYTSNSIYQITTNSLYENVKLKPFEMLISENQRFIASFLSNGNFVIYVNSFCWKN